MFAFLTKRPTWVKAVLFFSIIPLVFFLNIWLKMFIGGLLIVAALIAAMCMPRVLFGFYFVFNLGVFVFFAIENNMPSRVIHAQGLVFLVSLLVASAAGIEIRLHMHKVNQSQKENCKLTKALIYSFITAIDAKDHYLHHHSFNVSHYAKAIAKNMGYSDKETESIGLAALFHDIGKLSVSEDILNKPEKLDENEWRIMKQHACDGAEILKNVEQLKLLLPLIKYHHRHYNGEGYPVDCPMEEVPRESMIIGVADAFDAMTSDRPYRKAMTLEAAHSELKRCSGSQFDPVIVQAFLASETGIARATELEIDLLMLFGNG